ncbi:MAG: TIM44-like domain-containing protein [Clostridia bacterium]|nr:TIM44-like domain-containing protein [Clostridia bacterium]
MNRYAKILMVLCLIFAIAIPTWSIADVGDFESYDSDWDSDWGSSSWDDDDYSWSSSSSDRDYHSSGTTSGSSGMETLVMAIIIVIIVIAAARGNKGKTNTYTPTTTRTTQNGYSSGYVRDEARSKQVAESIRENDKFFNDDKFITDVKNKFIKLQNAWSERDWETIRPIESESLFEQHSKQLQGYITRGQINKMERISVNFAELVSYSVDNEKETVVVALNSSMVDYIIDEKTGNVLKGDRDTRRTNTYKLSFIRKKGVKTEKGTDEVKTTNCPNCGAPTRITSSGKCEYCGSVITIGEHDWVLNDMERF